jgi:alpha 1,2-mannosyltransferase
MNHPSMKKFKYYWRLDSDSFILSRIETDPFKTMKDREFVYCDFGTKPLNREDGWRYSGKEILWAREKLWESTQEFLRQKKLQDFDYDGEVYNTNLEIVDLDFFRANEYQSFFSYMDKIGGFYYNRWGDAPFRWLGLKLFSSPEKVWFAQETIDYCYQHGSLVVGIDKLDYDCLNLVPDVFRRMLNR